MRTPFFAIVTVALCTLFLGVSAAPATAAEPAPDKTPTVSEILAANPGGTLIDERTISWQDGTIVLTLESDRVARAVGSCATGAFCAYSAANLGGSKLTFTTCDTTHSTAALGAVRSIANARSSGYVQGQNSASSALVTVVANASSSSTPTGVVKIRCVS